MIWIIRQNGSSAILKMLGNEEWLTQKDRASLEMALDKPEGRANSRSFTGIIALEQVPRGAAKSPSLGFTT